MPTRKAVTISLDPQTWATLSGEAVNHDGNISAAVRAFILNGVEVSLQRDPQVEGHTIAVSDAGYAVLEKLADESGRSVDEVAKLGLRYAVQYAPRWLTSS